ncbi:MAG: class II fructose-bisphosphate aldolase [Salinibacterium amurskyense]
MPHTPILNLLSDASTRSVAVGAFNVILVETAEALVAAAESVNKPIVLQVSENCVRYHGGLPPIANASLAIARSASVPVSLHLDHAEDRTLISYAIALGFDSVMFDGSHLEYDENVAATAAVVREAHASGVAVEAELGEVGGKDGVHAPGVRTDPAEAQRFVAATGVDSLAVAVGSSHQMTSRTSELDLELIAELRNAVDVPLVLHGSSGVADDMIQAAVEAGIRKVNISTHLNRHFTDAVRTVLESSTDIVDPRKYVDAGRHAMAAETARILEFLTTPTSTTVR